MTKCDRICELIANGAHLDPAADGFRDVAEHALECRRCAETLRAAREVERALAESLRWCDPGEGFNARVMRGIQAKPRAAWGWRGVAIAAAACAVLALLVATMFKAAPAAGLHPVRVLGGLALAGGDRVDRVIPYAADVTCAEPKSAFEVVRGVGFALRPDAVFQVDPATSKGYTRLVLKRGGAAVSVKPDGPKGSEKVEIALAGGMAVLTNDADFLIEARANGAAPALYVDRGRVLVSFEEGVSAVERGEHVDLVPGQLLSRARAGESRIKEDLASLEAECAALREQIGRYEEMVRTYSTRLRDRSAELALAKEALASAPDAESAKRIEDRVAQETNAVDNLDFVLGEHTARITELRGELPKRLKELREKETNVAKQQDECRRGLALLAGMR